jgi:hypothetical protein
MLDKKKVNKILKDELALQTRHCKLLEAQQRALISCDRRRFTGMQEEYALMLTLLDSQEAMRNAAMEDDDGHVWSLSTLIEELPDKDRRPLDMLRNNLKRTTERNQALGQQNQKLIQNELEYIAFTLDLFVEAGRKAETDYTGRISGTARMLLDRRA